MMNENASAVLMGAMNVYRGWRWIETASWASKLDGASWVLEKRKDRQIISISIMQ